jgi:riboflavin synthase
MFTGIVGALGEVRKVDDESDRIWVSSPLLGDCELGASVAVNGVCLTVSSIDSHGARFDVSQETRSRTTIGDLIAGDTVNLERPLRVGSELGGHLVQGHVDGVGVAEKVESEGDGRRVRIRIGAELEPYLVEKGSVTVDGVSLTVTNADASCFEVALVPHTLQVTTLGELAVGERVNVEVDVVARYASKLLKLEGFGADQSDQRDRRT